MQKNGRFLPFIERPHDIRFPPLDPSKIKVSVFFYRDDYTHAQKTRARTCARELETHEESVYLDIGQRPHALVHMLTAPVYIRRRIICSPISLSASLFPHLFFHFLSLSPPSLSLSLVHQHHDVAGPTIGSTTNLNKATSVRRLARVRPFLMRR